MKRISLGYMISQKPRKGKGGMGQTEMLVPCPVNIVDKQENSMIQ